VILFLGSITNRWTRAAGRELKGKRKKVKGTPPHQLNRWVALLN